MKYVYNLSGALIEETYPSGRVVKNVLNNDGELALVQSKKTANHGFFNYADSFTYNAAGAVTSMQLGNGKWESTQFNSRLQPTQIALGTTPGATNLLDLDYSYGTTANNGNVLSQTITVPTVGSNNGFTAVQTYTYDSLNRINDATENVTPVGGSASQSWKQTFTYDRYGNRNFDEANTTTLPKNCNNFTEVCAADRKIVNPSINAANNRLNTSEDYVFDDSGNTTTDAEGRTFIYDAENKQIEVINDKDETIGEYFYDRDGKRIKKITYGNNEPLETTIFVYDASGRLAAEYSTTVEASETAKVGYLTNDHLGSPRINTDQNGAITARHDYHPFGEEVYTSQRTSGLNYAGDTVRQKFTGYERDTETDLDFAQARMYGFSHGRFTIPDPLLSSGRVEHPQTWNRYSYVLNNPLYYTDPYGLYECTGTTDQCSNLRNELANAKAKLASIENIYERDSDEYKKTVRALNSYGCESIGGNCVDASGNTINGTDGNPIKDTSNIVVDFNYKGDGGETGLKGNKINISFNAADFKGPDPFNQGLIAHEGSHAADAQDFLATGKSVSQYQSEYDGVFVGAVVGEFVAKENKKSNFYMTITTVQNKSYDITVWDKSWVTPDLSTLRNTRRESINAILSEDQSYLLTPTNTKGKSPIFFKK